MFTGAPAAGLVATSIISNTLEDFLVMGMASLAAYASVLNLPLRCVLPMLLTCVRMEREGKERQVRS